MKVDSSMDIRTVYERIASFPSNFDGRRGSIATSRNSELLDTLNRDSKEPVHEKSSPVSSFQGPFVLVQAMSTGFGDWFLVNEL